MFERLRALGLDPERVERAAAEGRLLEATVEHALADDARYTAAEVAERAGLEVSTFLRRIETLGRARPGNDEPAFGDEDLQAAGRIRVLTELGLSESAQLDQLRVVRPALNQIAEAFVQMVVHRAVDDARDELELAVRYAELADTLVPLAEPILGYALRIYLRQALRNIIIGHDDIILGHLAKTQEVTVCFADLVSYTSLAERLDAGALARVTARFGELVALAAGPPVRLVKMLGDGAMLVSGDTGALVDTATEMLQAAEVEGEHFPAVHVGLSRGMALPQTGDWYGPPVNRASRIGAAAPGGKAWGDHAVVRAAHGHRWRGLGDRQLKGIDAPTPLYELAM